MSNMLTFGFIEIRYGTALCAPPVTPSKVITIVASGSDKTALTSKMSATVTS